MTTFLRLIALLLGYRHSPPMRERTAVVTIPEPDPVSPVPPPPPDPVEDAETFGPATHYVRALKRKGYRLFDNNEQDHNLNIVGVRNTGGRFDRFDCKIVVFWREPSGAWRLIEWPATTYPGKRYLVEKLLNKAGAAILQPGQWPVYQLDTHNGKYRALCQRRGTVRVYRDGDRDREYDLAPSTLMDGWFGINIHAPVTPDSSKRGYVAQTVYAASAGCQVFQSLDDFLEFRALCEKAAANWGNAFTYTLILDTDLDDAAAEAPGKEPVPPAPDRFDALPSTGAEWNASFSYGTAGIRNKNLLNVKQGSDPWRWSTGKDGRGHAIFPTFPKGLRAGIHLLRVYWERHRLHTIADILRRWAPATDTIGSLPGAPPNSPKAYSEFVARRMGVEPMTPLRLFRSDGAPDDRDQLFALVAAMAAYENDADLELPRGLFNEALDLL